MGIGGLKNVGEYGKIERKKVEFKTLRGLSDVFRTMIDEVLGAFQKRDVSSSQVYHGECGRGDGLDLPMISVEEHDAMIARADEIRRTHRVFRD